MSDVIISAQNIGLRYTRRRPFSRAEYYEALKDVSFEIRRGETVGVVGRNGAGKSTLLKILSGIYQPDRGKLENRAGKTSLLTLQVGFDQNLCGRDNVILSGMLLGFQKDFIKSKLDDIKEYSELGQFFYEPIKSYSAGMRARLGFSTVVYLAPDVILLDEVLAVGDEKFRGKASQTMEEIIKQDHRTVIMVSHARNAILKLCDRVIWIEHGVVKDQGDPLTIMNAYQLPSARIGAAT